PFIPSLPAPLGGAKKAPKGLSGNNRNVRILATVEMSGVGTLSLLALERLPPGVVLGWTPRLRIAILGRAVGRIGLRRSATRAPGGRLYARGRGPLNRVPALCFPAGVGRPSVKLRGSGGR